MPVATGTIVTYHGIKLGSLAADQLHRRLGRRAARPGREGAPRRARAALILDLRDNAGGLLNEAVNVASIFIPDGTIVSTHGRGPAAAGVRGQGRRDLDQHPDGGARRSRHRLGGGDRHRRAPGPRAAPRSSARTPTARASSRRSSRCPTAARSTSPSASTSPRAATTSGGGGVREGAGITPDIYAATTPGRQPDKALAGRRADRRRRAAVTRRRRAAQRRGRGRRPRVAVLERRGKFLVAEPFFGPGPRLVVSRDRSASRRRSGRGPPAAPGATAVRGGQGDDRPPARAARRRARRDRGADGRPRAAPGVRPGGRARGAGGVGRRDRVRRRRARRRHRRDLRSLPTFTIDPASARDFDDAISAAALEDGGVARVGAHRRRVGVRDARARSSIARPTGAGRACTSRARSSRCCRARSRTTPARWSRVRTAWRSRSRW